MKNKLFIVCVCIGLGLLAFSLVITYKDIDIDIESGIEKNHISIKDIPKNQHILKIKPPSANEGKVVITTPDDGSIDCGSVCIQKYTKGNQIKISSQPEKGYQFESWSGGCAAAQTRDCDLTMDENKEVGVIFIKNPLEQVTLTISTPPSKEGRVISTNAKGNRIECGETCSQESIVGSSIIITAKAEKGFKFDAWGGACAEFKVAECKLAMDKNKKVSVSFKEDKKEPIPVLIKTPANNRHKEKPPFSATHPITNQLREDPNKKRWEKHAEEHKREMDTELTPIFGE